MSTRSRKRRQFIKNLSQLLGISESMVYRYIAKYNALNYPKEYLEALVAIEYSKIYFYTYPPVTSTWSYLLLNVFNYKDINRFIDKPMKINSIILDAGVTNYWKKPCSEITIDYDNDYWNQFWKAVDYLKSVSREKWITLEVVVPDYPDDYSREWKKEHCLWIDSYTNIDRTFENIFYIIQQDKNIKWLLPAQGYEDIPQSILISLEIIMNHKLHRKYRVALANLCTSKRSTTILETIKIAREYCKNCSFHIFGPSIKAIEDAVKLGYMKQNDSFDTNAWTYPRNSNMWSAKNEKQRRIYFRLYLSRVAEALTGKVFT